MRTKSQLEFKPTWLYIKQHNVTGLKYFGKTVRKDPTIYKGSGTLWRRHIAKHGNNVSTSLIGPFYSREDIQLYAIMFSISNNIVNSEEWANLIPEDGLSGGSVPGMGKGRIRSQEHKNNISLAKKGTPCSDQARRNLDRGRENRIYTPMTDAAKEKLRNSKLGKKATDETKEKLRLARAEQLASNNIQYKIVTPDGTSYIFNRLEIKNYCKLTNLAYPSLLAKGKQGKLYKGHKAIKI